MATPQAYPAATIHHSGGNKRPALIETTTGALEDVSFVGASRLASYNMKQVDPPTNANAAAAGVLVGELYRGVAATNTAVVYVRWA